MAEEQYIRLSLAMDGGEYVETHWGILSATTEAYIDFTDGQSRDLIPWRRVSIIEMFKDVAEYTAAKKREEDTRGDKWVPTIPRDTIDAALNALGEALASEMGIDEAERIVENTRHAIEAKRG